MIYVKKGVWPENLKKKTPQNHIFAKQSLLSYM